MTTILTIDLGGTKCDAALWQSTCTQPQLIRKITCPTDFTDEQGLIAALSILDITDDTEAAVLAVAGRTDNTDGSITLTNNPCTVNIARLQAALPGGCRLCVLNDLEALAYALPYIPSNALHDLNPNADHTFLQRPSPQLAVSVSTGFGAAALLPGYRVLPTEAGHARFTPVNHTQAMLCHKISANDTECITVEDLLSGRGLAAIYQAIGNQPAYPAEITALANSGNAAALATVREFSQMLGNALGNLALCFLPGAIYLSGGVCRHLGSLINGRDIMRDMVINGAFAHYLQKLPIMLITAEAPTLLGGAMYAERFLLG